MARLRHSTTSAAAVASAVAACTLNAVSLAPCARQAEDALPPVEVGAAFAEHDAAREALHAGGGQIDRVYNDQRETNKLDRPDELGA